MKASKSNGKGSAETAAAESAESAKVGSQPLWRLVFPIDVQVFSFLLLVAVCVFSNGIRGELTFDDHLAIEKNMDAWADKTSLSSIFFNDFWGKQLDRIESNGSYRPITVLTFRIQYWLMGNRHSPQFLHLFNYLLAFWNVCLVYYLARLYVYIVVPSSSRLLDSAAEVSLTAALTSPLHAVPMAAALLYIVHPVHVDSVTSIVGRCELLYCFFGMLGFFCVHHYLNQVDTASGTAVRKSGVSAKVAAVEERRRTARAPRTGFAERYVVMSAYALAVSILCKDSAITFTAIYGVHAGVMYACSRCSGRRSLFVLTVAVVELVGYLAFRRSFIGSVDLVKSPLLRQTENPQYFVPEGLFHWLSMRWVIQVKNLELLFFPTSLCCEYSYNCIPHMYSLQDPRVPYFTVVTLLTVAVVVGCLYGTFARRSRAALIGLLGFLWVAIPYAPVSHLFIAVGTFIAERCLYVPSIGAVLLITFAGAARGLRHGRVSREFYVVLLLLCVGWGVFSHRRNEDWVNDELLFRSAIKTCPNSGKAYTQLATLVLQREQELTAEVIGLAKASLRNDPKLRDGYFYLAALEANVKRNMTKAYEYLRLCVSDPFALPSCRDSYGVVRRMLFPDMTEVEQLMDDASTVTIDSQKAVVLRQAALYAMQKEQRPCVAAALFGQALDLWNRTGLFWHSDVVNREAKDQTYCNAVYWYGQSTAACESGEGVSEDPEEQDDRSRRLSALVPLVVSPGIPDAAAAARRAADVADRLRQCGTDWHAVLAQPKYQRDTYPNRLTQFLTLSDGTMSVLQRYANLTQPHTAERNDVDLAMLDVALRQYCHIAAVLNDATVRQRLTDLFPELVHGLEQGLPALRQERLPMMLSLRRQLRASPQLTAEQRKKLRSILALTVCSDDLTSLSM